MKVSKTSDLFWKKISRIFGFLILIRVGLYIPVPNIDLELFSVASNPVSNPLVGLAKSNNAFLAIGSLGIVPYLGSSASIQLISLIIPSLNRLQKEEGEIGRQQIRRYLRYLTLGWAIVLSTEVAFVSVKPIIFNWDLMLALKVIFSLTTGSMLTIWFTELITEEKLGNGSSMVICINIIGGISPSLIRLVLKIKSSSNFLYIENIVGPLFLDIIVYSFSVIVIIYLQETYKKINIISAQQLNFNYLFPGSKVNAGCIPIKLNPGGIMPVVFSSTITSFLLSLLQGFLVRFVTNTDGILLNMMIIGASLGLNVVLVLFCNQFYALLVLKPKDLSKNLNESACTVPGIKQGKETTQYISKTISRLSFIGGLFLAFLVCVTILMGHISKYSLSKNVTSIIILVGVMSDVTSQVKGFLVSKKYENSNNKGI
jgi:preprotein translocase subunit SecY